MKVKRIIKKDSKGKIDITEYDEENNLTYFKNRYGSETWNEYNSNGNLIHIKTLMVMKSGINMIKTEI